MGMFLKTMKVIWLSICLLGLLDFSVACVYNDTACTCAYRSSNDTCLRPSSDSSLCESYTCGKSYVCDCSGDYTCEISACAEAEIAYLPVTTISPDGLTNCTVSAVSVCTNISLLVSDSSDDSTDDTEVTYNYTVAASGDFTVFSSGETLSAVTVRASRRGGKEATTSCIALIIELEYVYDPDMEQGISIAIQDSDSGSVYKSGEDLTIWMAFNPTGDYRETDSFDYSSWKTPVIRSGLRQKGSFAKVDDEFDAEPIGFDTGNDTALNEREGTYVYKVQLPFCENGKRKKHGSSGGLVMPGEKPKDILGDDKDIDDIMDVNKLRDIPPAFKDVIVIPITDDIMSVDEIEDKGLKLPFVSAKFAIAASGDFEVFILGYSVFKGDGKGVFRGMTDLPCTPLIVEVQFGNDTGVDIPAISVAIDLVHSGKNRKRFVSASNLPIGVAYSPPKGYADPQSEFNFSAFAPPVHILNIKGDREFELMQVMYEAEPVAYLGNVTNEVQDEVGIDDMEIMNNQTGIAPRGKYVFVVFPPCPFLYGFDKDGEPVQKKIEEFGGMFGNPMENNETMGDGRDSKDNEEEVDKFKDVGTVVEDGSNVDNPFPSLNVENVTYTTFSYAITASQVFRVVLLGQSVLVGTNRNIYIGNSEMPCVPVIIHAVFFINQSTTSVPGLSLSITGGIGSKSHGTGTKDLQVLVAVNPKPGYDDPKSGYDFANFRPAVLVPSISDVGAFGKMKYEMGAIPVGPFATFSSLSTETIAQGPTGSPVFPPVLNVVYVVRIPTCDAIFLYDAEEGNFEQDEVIDELFEGDNEIIVGNSGNGENAEPWMEPTNGVINPNKTVVSIESILGQVSSGFKNVVIEEYVDNPFTEEKLGQHDLKLHQLPVRPSEFAIVGSNDFQVHILGKPMLSVSKMSVVPGSAQLPCVPIFVEMDFQNDTGIQTPSISVVLNMQAQGNDDYVTYLSGWNLQIVVVHDPPKGFADPKIQKSISGLKSAFRLPEPEEDNGFKILREYFGASQVGYGNFINHETTTEVVLEDMEREVNMTWVAPSGKYVFVIFPPCPKLYSFDQNGNPFGKAVSNVVEDGFFGTGQLNETQFDVLNIGKAFEDIGINIGGLSKPTYKLALTSTEDFTLFTVGQPIAMGARNEVLRTSAALPCLPIIVLSRFVLNERNIILPSLSMSISQEVNGTEVTFVSGSLNPNNSLEIFMGDIPNLGFDDMESKGNSSSFGRAISLPLLAMGAGYDELYEEYGAVPVGLSFFANIMGEVNETMMSTSPEPSQEAKSSDDELKGVGIVYIIQPPMCKPMLEVDDDGILLFDDMPNGDEFGDKNPNSDEMNDGREDGVDESANPVKDETEATPGVVSPSLSPSPSGNEMGSDMESSSGGMGAIISSLPSPFVTDKTGN